ncbi:zf-CGNR multi-domain protein [Streptomyces sp. CNQ-509]|uniref:CGNR zinc finger domain-containing protein n=1 Tax=unclassified Streptomyces TaxID=2593676 RepID=UPI00062E0C55|nr:CGNR zinc finger domain-containing protein [Streptomyces sp. CNQ-509]AKH84203.1 zf-CGNR multi-domain protein [Streptomyces sp. CNQ-509]
MVDEASARAPGVEMRPPDGQVFRFDPGALSLELLTTGGPGPFARYEVLRTPADVAAWAAASRLRPVPELAVTDDDVPAVRHLRDALFRLTQARARAEPLPAADLAVLNAAAAEPPLAPRLTPDGTPSWAPGPATTARLLATVARDAVDLFSGPYGYRIRECAGERCYLLFADTSRPGRRRWCSMERCGNRHKVRTLRARREADHS